MLPNTLQFTGQPTTKKCQPIVNTVPVWKPYMFILAWGPLLQTTLPSLPCSRCGHVIPF